LLAADFVVPVVPLVSDAPVVLPVSDVLAKPFVPPDVLAKPVVPPDVLAV